MSVIQGFLKLTLQEKFLIIAALCLHWFIRIMLWLLPFSVIKNLTNKLTSNIQEDIESDISAERIIWTVKVVSAYTPRSTCLSKALTAHILLARHHYSSKIRIGVSKYEGKFEAHAWLVYDNQIVMSGSRQSFKPIYDIDEKSLKK